MQRLRSIGVPLVLAAAVLACGEPPRGTRVVLVTVDTLRLDAFLGSGDAPSVMPRTLGWAERGAVFERCFTASPVTQPTHASLLTGLFPWQHGVTRNGLVLDAEHRSVAEILSAEGWETGAVVASFPLTRRMGLDQGFARYVDTLDRRIGAQWNGTPVDEFYSLGAAVTDRALDLLAMLERDRQFLWVHYFDPHAPYGDVAAAARGADPLLLPKFMEGVFEAEGPKARSQAIRRGRLGYDADTRALDGELARLLAALEADAGRFDTHVVLVSDHGESFGEDGSLGHGKRLSPPQIAVPLAIVSPRVTAGRRDEVVGSVDVAATLLALAGVDARLPHGRDLSAPVADGLVAGMRTSVTEPLVDPRVGGPEHVLEADRWFVVLDGTIRAGDPEAVWDEDDETRPSPEDVAATARELFAIFAAETTGAREADDESTRAALEALGYAQ